MASPGCAPPTSTASTPGTPGPDTASTLLPVLRVNEQPGLATLHTLWLREHNRVALQLTRINPHWSDDRAFLETRRLVGALMQHITYNEWLPIILGPRVLEIFELRLLARGHYRGYNDSVNPTIANSFAAAAFR